MWTEQINSLYAFWFIGLSFALSLKLWLFVRNRPKTMSVKQSINDWLTAIHSEKDEKIDNASSWISTIFVSWVLAYLYTHNLLIFESEYFVHHISLALLLGFSTEWIAPFIGKWFVRKIVVLFEAK